MQRLLNHVFKDRARAQREIAALAPHLPERVQNLLDLMLVASAAPEQGLHYFTRLRERQPDAFERLTRSSAGLRCLVAIFTHSHFLAEELLQHPDWANPLLDTGALTRPMLAEDLRSVLNAELPSGVPDPLLLARFRRRHIMRIAVRDVLGLGTLPEVTGELSALAEVLVDVAYERIYKDLVARYGVPWSEEGQAHFAVIALGKLGGRELNYSSDIDLMFLYSANGSTVRAESGKGAVSNTGAVSNSEFFKRAANQLTALLSTYTVQGLCYRVDLRLRPDGSLGEVCISLEGARTYYETRGRDWELQMLIKARVAAGHRPTGKALLDAIEPLSYSSTLDFSAVEQLSATRERLNEKLASRAARKRVRQRGPVDVKLEPGGIRDIEFLVQCLQRLRGGAEPWVRHGGTLLALSRLQDKDFLSGSEYGQLASAYQFLRHLEHRLQLDEDLQTHTLPRDPEALELLARRMPGGGSAEWLQRELTAHFTQVREIYDRVVHSRSGQPEVAVQPLAGRHASNIVMALDQRAPVLAGVLAKADLRHGYQSFEHFLERISHDPTRLERLDSDPDLAARTLDLFEHSPYFGEELIRAPELLDDLAHAHSPLMEEEPVPGEAAGLRHWYRREMVRIQVESICRSQPIFDTLARTSELADAVIARAYEIAMADVLATNPPADSQYRPDGEMLTIALGRLGMREFDLSSDADLIFVLADAAVSQMPFWTRVAERLVDLITAYTGAGVLFAVDTRLRPNGGSGPLVQSASTVLEYFRSAAEAWEGITYMKSRAVAGEPTAAQDFLQRLQDVDWQRYGQGGRSRADLRQMRMKLEKELGQAHPLKAGRGGYYDIDFLLMYLRLKSAGVFFKVLNTPARIEVLQNLGHLSPADARFLHDAGTFYRALDHGLRVLSGHAEGRLPKSEAQMEALGALLPRWSKTPLSDLPRVRAETRAMFDRFFG